MLLHFLTLYSLTWTVIFAELLNDPASPLSHSSLAGLSSSRLTRSTPSRSDDPSHSYRSYQNLIYCNPSSRIRHPKNVAQLQAIIRGAIKNGQTVKVIGARHSMTDIICTEGTPISTKHFKDIKVHPKKNTATFGSGLELVDAMEALHKVGLSLESGPSFGGITIGGAIGTGAHGSSLRHSASLSSLVVKVALIDGQGDLRVISKKDGEDFQAIGLHLGMLGAIINVTLKTVPLFKMTVENYMTSESILLDGTALDEAKNRDFYQLFWFPSMKSVVVSTGNYTNDLDTVGNATSNWVPSMDSSSITAFHNAFESAQATRNRQVEYELEQYTANSFHKPVIGRPPIFSEDGQFVNPATGYGHRLLTNKCRNKCVWENGKQSLLPDNPSTAFDIKELPKLIKTIKRLLRKLPAAFPLLGILIRFARASDKLMSIEYGRETVHFEWASLMRTDPYNDARSGLGTYQAILQAMMNDHDGRPHWGKNGLYYFTSPILQRRVPNLKKFLKAMKRFDPHGIFLNKFGERLLNKSNELNIDPKVKHCAIQDYCLCEENSDCAKLQTCENFQGKYQICKDATPAPLAKPIKKFDANSTWSRLGLDLK